MSWQKGVVDYEYYVYDGSQGSISALAKKDLYIILDNGKKILKELYSLSWGHTIGELNVGDTVLIVFNTVLILKKNKHQPVTAEILLSKIAERLEHMEHMMEDMI